MCVRCVMLLEFDCLDGALWPAVGAVHRRAFQDGAAVGAATSGKGVAVVGGQWPILGVQTFG